MADDETVTGRASAQGLLPCALGSRPCAAASAAALCCGRRCCKAAKQAVMVMATGAAGDGHWVIVPLKLEECTCGDGDVEDTQ